MPRVVLTEQQKEERKQRVVQLYKEGYTYQQIQDRCRIPMQNIKAIAIEAGIYVPKRQAISNSKHPEGNPEKNKVCGYSESMETINHKEKMEEAFKTQYVGAIKKYIKVGDIIKIKTDKGVFNQKGMERVKSGVIRTAVVKDTSSNQFCVVELPGTGCRECIHWSAIFNAIRNKSTYIE